MRIVEEKAEIYKPCGEINPADICSDPFACEVVKVQDTIDIPPMELDEIGHEFILAKTIYEPPYKFDSGLADYMKVLIALRLWGHQACPHGIGDFHDKDISVTQTMHQDCDLCKDELRRASQ
jgi:hypothetical protein